LYSDLQLHYLCDNQYKWIKSSKQFVMQRFRWKSAIHTYMRSVFLFLHSLSWCTRCNKKWNKRIFHFNLLYVCTSSESAGIKNRPIILCHAWFSFATCGALSVWFSRKFDRFNVKFNTSIQLRWKSCLNLLYRIFTQLFLAVFSRAINRKRMLLRERDRCGMRAVSSIGRARVMGISQCESNREIVKSTRWSATADRDVRSGKRRGHYYSRLFLEALRQSRFSRPVQAVQERTRRTLRTRADVQHTYAYIRATADTRISTHEYESLYKHTGTRIHIKGRIYRFSSHD